MNNETPPDDAEQDYTAHSREYHRLIKENAQLCRELEAAKAEVLSAQMDRELITHLQEGEAATARQRDDARASCALWEKHAKDIHVERDSLQSQLSKVEGERDGMRDALIKLREDTQYPFRGEQVRKTIDEALSPLPQTEGRLVCISVSQLQAWVAQVREKFGLLVDRKPKDPKFAGYWMCLEDLDNLITKTAPAPVSEKGGQE